MKRKREADIESDNLHSIRHVIKDTFMQIEHQAKACSGEGTPSGFSALDELTAGFHAGDLIIIGSRPSAGKTALGLNIVRHAGVELKKPVVIFSLETPKDQLVLRLLCAEAMLNLNMVRNGFIKKEDWPKLTSAVGKLAEAPIFIADSPSVTVKQILNKAKKFKKEHGELGLLVIDYLQLMSSGNADKTKQTKSDVCKLLKAAAKEVNVPVIAFSQTSRNVDTRKDKRPTIADLRGINEKDADVILFIYRDEIYNKLTASNKNAAEIIVAKNRKGATGIAKLAFNHKCLKFEEPK